MKLSLLVTLLISAHIISAQPFSVKVVKSADMTKQTVVVESATKPVVAKRITERIRQDWGDGIDEEEASFNFQVGANSESVFDIYIESSYAAAGLHITSNAYHFDAKTGDTFGIDRIFAAGNQPKLNKTLHQLWKAALKRAADAATESRRDEYKECLKTADQSEVTIERFMIMDNGIRFWAGSCLEGTNYDFQADKSRGPHILSWNDLLSLLTPYGFSFFYQKQSPPYQTLMRGTIDGKYPVSFALLKTRDLAISGSLSYDRLGTPILLRGTFDGDRITFHELDESANEISEISVTWDGTKLSGRFTNLKTKKQMPFVASVAK